MKRKLIDELTEGFDALNDERNGKITFSIFKNGKDQAICFPTDMSCEHVEELEITRSGDTITLRPVRPSWSSLAELSKADADFLQERQSVISDEGRYP